MVSMRKIRSEVNRASGSGAVEARAGGTMVLVAEMADGRALQVGDIDGDPFGERQERADGVIVYVYASEDARLNGDEPIGSGQGKPRGAIRRALADADAHARTYVIGAPVIVTVWPNGHVSFTVDTSEMGDAVREIGATGDAARIDAAHDAGTLEILP